MDQPQRSLLFFQFIEGKAHIENLQIFEDLEIRILRSQFIFTDEKPTYGVLTILCSSQLTL
jgi:hypothetical protein